MSTGLRIAALIVALVALGVWLETGAHRGWTKNNVIVIEVDEVTGLQNPVPQKKFIMGVELLGAGLAVAAGLAGASFFFKSRQTKTDQQNQT